MAVELRSQVGSFCFGVYFLIVKLPASSLITHRLRNPSLSFFSFFFSISFPVTWRPLLYGIFVGYHTYWGYLDLDVYLGEWCLGLRIIEENGGVDTRKYTVLVPSCETFG